MASGSACTMQERLAIPRLTTVLGDAVIAMILGGTAKPEMLIKNFQRNQ